MPEPGLGRYIGYFEPDYNSHDSLDQDTAVQEEVRNVAHLVARAVRQLRADQLSPREKKPRPPRPK